MPEVVTTLVREPSPYTGTLMLKEKDVRIIHRDDSIGDEKVSAAEIMEHLLKIEVGNQRTDHAMRLSNVMRKLGWERPSNGYVTIAGHGRVKGYFRKR
jgi:hypothetical protein